MKTAFFGAGYLLLALLFHFIDLKIFSPEKERLWFSIFKIAEYIALILCATSLLIFASDLFLRHRKKPQAESDMVGNIYKLAAAFAILFSIVYYFGKISSFWTFFSLFGGMLLGWSLQSPISGFAAWILVSLKRPFRPGDRVQFPSLGLTGDVKDIGAMYTVLDQVGGSVGSEEAVGRNILIPNAMLFGQVIINYTVIHEASYMLDEVVVRITYDSNWEKAEEILLQAANETTGDVIKATGVKPYIRSDLYDYGVYMRLRYQTRVKDRAETAYRINKEIFEGIQRVPTVDIAIPFIYSNRAGMDRKEADANAEGHTGNFRELLLDSIVPPSQKIDPKEIEQLASSISRQGLLQPVIVVEDRDHKGKFELLAGHMRYEACKKLGWSTITAIVRNTSY